MISKMIDGQEVLMSGTSPIYSEDLAYDNTQSGLSALNIQDAVDETVELVDELTSGLCNENLLLNPWFTVNSKGQSSYTGGYECVDKWQCYATASGEPDITIGNVLLPGQSADIFQIIPNTRIPLTHEPYTLSAIIDGQLYSFTCTPYGDGQAHGAWSPVLVDGIKLWMYEMWNGNQWIFCISVANATNNHTIKAVKFEKGEISTLLDETVPNYEEERVKCGVIEVINQEISSIVDVYGSKNLLQNNAVTQTINGVTFTVNADKSITASGTATSNTVLLINNNQIVKAGSYIASYVAPGGGQGYTFVGDTIDGSLRVFHCNNDTPAPFTLSSDTALNIYFWIASGVTMNVTLYPMIRDARISDATYVPYAMTNRKMTDKFEELDTDFSRAQVRAISSDRIQTNSDALSDNYKRMLSAGNAGSNPDFIYMQAAKTSADEATYQDMLMWCYNGSNLFADLVKNGQVAPAIDISRANIRPEYLTNADDLSSYINERLNWAMWDGNTLGTPYKTGQTGWSAGAIITTMYNSSLFAYQLCMPVGNGPWFYRGYSAVAAGGGGWTAWLPVADGNTLSSVYSRTAGIDCSYAASDLSSAIWQNRNFNVQYWNINTLNTPYKQGATAMGDGLCITSVLNDGSNVYVNQVAMPVGSAQMFIRSFNGSVWSSWSSVISGSVSGTTLNLIL